MNRSLLLGLAILLALSSGLAAQSRSASRRAPTPDSDYAEAGGYVSTAAEEEEPAPAAPASRSSLKKIATSSNAAGSYSASGGCNSCDSGCGSCDSSCGSCRSGCGRCGQMKCCCPVGCRTYARIEYLLWWQQGDYYPPLVTESTSDDLDEVGVIGEVGTEVVFGDERIDDEVRHGGRIKVGHWFDNCGMLGVEGHFLATGTSGIDETFESDGSIGLAIPYFNVDPDFFGPDADVIAFTNGAGFTQVGSINVTTESDILSTGLLLRKNVGTMRGLRLDAVGGYRFFRLNDTFEMNSITTFTETVGTVPPVQPGTSSSARDLFDSENEFHGGELGLCATIEYNMFSLEALAKCAVGNNHSFVRVRGENTVTVPGPPLTSDTTQGGLFAQTSNIGNYSEDEFAWLPELNLTLSCRLTRYLQANMGYSFIYLSDVVRAGDQIDRRVDGDIRVGDPPNTDPARPEYQNDIDDFWVQGLSFGLQLEY